MDQMKIFVKEIILIDLKAVSFRLNKNVPYAVWNQCEWNWIQMDWNNFLNENIGLVYLKPVSFRRDEYFC